LFDGLTDPFPWDYFCSRILLRLCFTYFFDLGLLEGCIIFVGCHFKKPCFDLMFGAEFSELKCGAIGLPGLLKIQQLLPGWRELKKTARPKILSFGETQFEMKIFSERGKH